MTDEIDESNNYPIWVRHDSQGKVIWKADVFYSGFGKQKIYKAYDSWYMRKQMAKSQEVHLKGYELKFNDKMVLLVSHFKANKGILKINALYEKSAIIKSIKEKYMSSIKTLKSMIARPASKGWFQQFGKNHTVRRQGHKARKMNRLSKNKSSWF
jgi:hypothetical protein